MEVTKCTNSVLWTDSGQVLLSPSHEHLRSLSVVMVEEEALACVKRLDLSHIIGTQFKVEDVEVLSHTLLVG